MQGKLKECAAQPTLLPMRTSYWKAHSELSTVCKIRTEAALEGCQSHLLKLRTKVSASLSPCSQQTVQAQNLSWCKGFKQLCNPENTAMQSEAVGVQWVVELWKKRGEPGIGPGGNARVESSLWSPPPTVGTPAPPASACANSNSNSDLTNKLVCHVIFHIGVTCRALARQRFPLSSGAPSAMMSSFLFLQLEYKAPTAVGRRVSRSLWRLHRLPCPERLFQG